MQLDHTITGKLNNKSLLQIIHGKIDSFKYTLLISGNMVAISRRAFVGGAIALGAAGAYLWLSHKLGGGKLVERVAYGNQKLILDKFEKSGLTKVQPYTS